MRKIREIIGINEETGERRKFVSTYAAAKELRVNSGCIITSMATGTLVKDWHLYDTPDNIRKRIAELEETIKMLEE